MNLQKSIKMEVGNLVDRDESLSDDEIFFGKMSLKEAKKLIFINYPQRQTISYSTTNEEHNQDEIRIIETHSEPELVKVNKSFNADLKAVSSPNIIRNNFKESDLEIKPDDSFIKLEKMVTDLCMSPTDQQPKLDNTLEVVDFILNNAEHNKPEAKFLPCLDDIYLDVDDKTELSFKDSGSNNADVQTQKTNHYRNENNTESKIAILCGIPNTKLENSHITRVDSTSYIDLVECTTNKDNLDHENNISPETATCGSLKTKLDDYDAKVSNTSKMECTSNIYPVHCIPEAKCNTKMLCVTPQNKLNMNNNSVFKTPKNPVSTKKVVSAKKTPSRLNNYKHITSPIASYIKNCPQVPLVKDVHPQRPLPAKSSIPQPIKYVSKTNKENIQIPTVAYKSAKKTQMVTVPSQEKLPRGEWTSKLTSSLKKPVVITHGQRVVNNVTKNLNKRQEDSFANLTLQQAEISVCTKKSAL